jgi:uncharacterized protein with beta-barrel porin domain
MKTSVKKILSLFCLSSLGLISSINSSMADPTLNNGIYSGSSQIDSTYYIYNNLTNQGTLTLINNTTATVSSLSTLGTGIVINGFLNEANAGFINQDTGVTYGSVSLYTRIYDIENRGTVTNSTGSGLTFRNTAKNYGVIENQSGSLINGYGIIENGGSYTTTTTDPNTGNTTTVTIHSNGIINNLGTVSGNFTINNRAGSNIDNGNGNTVGTIIVDTINNYGTINNINGLIVATGVATGGLNNYSQLVVNSSGSFGGIMTNKSGGSITGTLVVPTYNSSNSVVSSLTLNTEANSIFTADINGISAGDANRLKINSVSGSSFVGNVDLGMDVGDNLNFGSSSTNSFTTGGTLRSANINLDNGSLNVGHAVTATTFTAATGTNLNFIASTTHSIGTVNLDRGSNMSVSAGATVDLGSSSVVNVGTSNGTGTAALVFNVANSTATGYGQLKAGTLNVTADGVLKLNVAQGAALRKGTVLTNIFQGYTGLNGVVDGAIITSNDSTYILRQVVNGNNVSILVEQGANIGIDGVVPTSGNSSSVISAINNLANSGNDALDDLTSKINALPTSQQEAAVKTLTPDVSGTNVQAVQAVSDAALGTVESHLEAGSMSSNSSASFGFSKGKSAFDNSSSGGLWASTFGGSVSNGSALGQKIFGANSAPGMLSQVDNGWGQVFGSSVSQTKREGVSGYNAQIAGFSFGTDLYRTEQVISGLSFSYAQTTAKGDASKTTINSYQLSGYSTKDFGKFYIDGLAAIAINRYEGSRTLFDNSVAMRNSNGMQYSLKGSIGYKEKLSDFTLSNLKFTDTVLTPFTSVQMSHLTQDTYTESGSSANLTVKNKSIDMFKVGIGFKVASSFMKNDKIFTPRFSVGFYNDFVGDAVDTTANFTAAPTASFNNRGASIARRSVKFGTGFDMLTKNNFTLSVDYIYETKQQFSAHTGSVKGKFTF